MQLKPLNQFLSLLISRVLRKTVAGKMENILTPPDRVRGIRQLDKKLFEKEIQIPFLNIKDIKVSSVLPLVKIYLLKIEKFKPVVHLNPDKAQIFLNPERVREWTDLSAEVQKSLEGLNLTKDNLKEKEYTLKYENYTVEDVLKSVLPKDREGLSSFTKIGHIVHVNLREHLLPYKNVIGEVLFDKTPGCKSVVNKVNMIDNTYRNFQMEVLQGSNDMLTTVKENTCTFEFDFSTVYWNSRLCTEHERIVQKLKPGDVLFDVFAGVGPFTIPAAKKKCTVYANDLNPESYYWLNHNKKLNKIKDEFFKSYNLDGKDFLTTILKQNLPKHLLGRNKVYIAMNLPGLAVEFLPAFCSLLSEEDLPSDFEPPTVFVYCFAKGEDYDSIAKDLVVKSFGCDFDVGDKIVDLFRVRTVSSMKEMMRVTVKLDRDILVGRRGKRKLEVEEGGVNKKCIIFEGEHGEKQEENQQRI